jgi:hypothetical protein
MAYRKERHSERKTGAPEINLRTFSRPTEPEVMRP